METSKLVSKFKPCPFCGSDVNIDFHTYEFRERHYQDMMKLAVKCDVCKAQGGEVEIPVDYDNGIRKPTPTGYFIEAAQNWNTRP